MLILYIATVTFFVISVILAGLLMLKVPSKRMGRLEAKLARSHSVIGGLEKNARFQKMENKTCNTHLSTTMGDLEELRDKYSVQDRELTTMKSHAAALNERIELDKNLKKTIKTLRDSKEEIRDELKVARFDLKSANDKLRKKNTEYDAIFEAAKTCEKKLMTCKSKKE